MFLTLSTLCLVFKWHPSHNKDHHQSQLCLRRPSFSTKEDHIKLYPHPPPPPKKNKKIKCLSNFTEDSPFSLNCAALKGTLTLGLRLRARAIWAMACPLVTCTNTAMGRMQNVTSFMLSRCSSSIYIDQLPLPPVHACMHPGWTLPTARSSVCPLHCVSEGPAISRLPQKLGGQVLVTDLHFFLFL